MCISVRGWEVVHADAVCGRLFRPVAYTAGATDEVSHSMGQRRVQLGMNVVATALPAGGADVAGPEGTPPQPEDVVLYFGIIDILQVRARSLSNPAWILSRAAAEHQKWQLEPAPVLMLVQRMVRSACRCRR